MMGLAPVRSNATATRHVGLLHVIPALVHPASPLAGELGGEGRMRSGPDLLAKDRVLELHRLVVVLDRRPFCIVENEAVLRVARQRITAIDARDEDGVGVVAAKHGFLRAMSLSQGAHPVEQIVGRATVDGYGPTNQIGARIEQGDGLTVPVGTGFETAVDAPTMSATGEQGRRRSR